MNQPQEPGRVEVTPAGAPARQRGLWLVVALVLGACILSLACGACGVVSWLRFRGEGPSWQSLGPQALATGVPDRRVVTAPPTGPQGGELRLYGGEPVTLDPALVSDSASSVYVEEIYSGLVTLDRNLQVVPDLAERWELSEDGRTYTFYLRRDAMFQDGRPVTAGDVQYSLERACSPALGSLSAQTYLSDIEGASAMMRGQAKGISGLRVIDEHTLSLTIDAPKAYFLAKLTYPTAFVVDRANVAKGEGWTDRPNGTGPFRLVQWDRQRIVLERNARYYGGPAALARVVFTLSGGMPMTMYENEQLDIVDVGLGDIERVLDPSNPLSAELTVIDNFAIQYLGMDSRTPPFDDPKVREAFARAIDRQRLARVVLKKTVTPATGILPPGFPAYQPDLQGLDFDPDLALQCLRDSKYKDAADLPEVVLHTSGEGGTMSPIVEAITAMLRTNLGVEVRVQQTPWATFLRDLEEGRYAFFMTGWIADYPDPENFLDLLLHSESGHNYCYYHNAEVNRLLEQARVEADKGRRMELYQQAEELVVRDAPWVPLWHDRSYMLTKPYVKGVVYSAAIRPWLKDVYLDR